MILAIKKLSIKCQSPPPFKVGDRVMALETCKDIVLGNNYIINGLMGYATPLYFCTIKGSQSLYTDKSFVLNNN